MYRPDGPGEQSPGLRPKADALGSKTSTMSLAAWKVARTGSGRKLSRPFRPQPFCHLSTQGVGLRPRPWAPFSRPVGPDTYGELAQLF
jgi:hypothetical protein